MATVTTGKKTRGMLPLPTKPILAEPAAPPLVVAASAAEVYTWEFWGHRGDQLAFALWIVCFSLLATVNLTDLLLGLFVR